MDSVSRRDFMKATGAAVAAFSANVFDVSADPLGLPVGLQLYTVADNLEKDFDGTLKLIGAIGYKTVEAAGVASFQRRTPGEIRQSLSAAGLTLPSAHLVDVTASADDLATLIGFCHQVGMTYMICATTPIGAPGAKPENLTQDDFKRAADLFNRAGTQIAKAGMKFAYHNHAVEFKTFADGSSGFDILLASTDHAAVHFQLDCGWAKYAGQDPAALLRKYPERIKLLHVKDEKPGFSPTIGAGGAPTTEIGKGSINWKVVFAAAKAAKIEWYFVEQEPPFSEMPPMDAIRASYQYLHALE